MNASPILSVENLVKHFPTGPRRLFRGAQQRVHAVDGVSFTLDRGRTLGLVGESGCGKSTVARLIVRAKKHASSTVMMPRSGRPIEAVMAAPER